MADIVKQLCFGSKVAHAMHIAGHQQSEAWEIMLDAATEIIRLRVEVELWRDRYESLLRDAQASEAHFDRMINEGP